MVLILSSKDDAHVEIVARKLAAKGAEYLWFNPASFPADCEIAVRMVPRENPRLFLDIAGQTVDLQQVTAIWDRRPEDPKPSPQITDRRLQHWVTEESRALLEGIWATLDCVYVPGREKHRYAAENKLVQLSEAARLGFTIPRTFITNRPEYVLEAFDCFEGRVVTKVLSNPVVWRDGEEWSTFTRSVKRRDLGYSSLIRYAPVIIQEYVPKKVELRITVVGSQVFAAEIHSQASRRTQEDWRHYDIDRTPHKPHVLPKRISELCVELVRSLHLLFGAIDMILTPPGDYVFLEINQNGQWAWIEELAGLTISDAIVDLLLSANRVPLKGIEARP